MGWSGRASTRLSRPAGPSRRACWSSRRSRAAGSRHTRAAAADPVRSSPSCRENATRCPFPIEPHGSAETAGSSRSSRRHAWSSAIETTCATCMSSTVKRAGSHSRVWPPRQACRRREPCRGHQRERAFVVFTGGSRQSDRAGLRSRHVSRVPAGPPLWHHAAVDDDCSGDPGERSESQRRSSMAPARRWRSNRERPIFRPRTRQRNFLVSLASGTMTRVDVAADGGARPGASMSPAISADGRYVAFASRADLTCAGAAVCQRQRRGRRLCSRHPDERHEPDQPQRLGRRADRCQLRSRHQRQRPMSPSYRRRRT